MPCHFTSIVCFNLLQVNKDTNIWEHSYHYNYNAYTAGNFGLFHVGELCRTFGTQVVLWPLVFKIMTWTLCWTVNDDLCSVKRYSNVLESMIANNLKYWTTFTWNTGCHIALEMKAKKIFDNCRLRFSSWVFILFNAQLLTTSRIGFICDQSSWYWEIIKLTTDNVNEAFKIVF
jgi:hypothetical protein